MTKEAVQLPLPGIRQEFGAVARRLRRSRSARIGAIAQPLRHRDQAALYAARLERRRYADRSRLSRPVPLHARHLSDHAPRPHLDAAPVDRPRHAGRLQRARAPDAGAPARRRSACCRAIPASAASTATRSIRCCSAPAARSSNTVEHMDRRARRRAARRDFDRDERSVAVHAARLHARRRQAARRRLGIDLRHVEPERLHLPFHRQPHVLPARRCRARGACCTDHIEFCREHVPNWNPISVVGQHMQQAGATPAETMASRFSTALQYARGLHRPRHGHRRPAAPLHVLLRHLDQLLRGDRQVPRRRGASGRALRASASAPRTRAPGASSSTARPPASISREQQPLNNIARVAVQAIAGILSGLQSMHTDAYDEAVATPTEETARIAVATQNILREEAHLCDVIDPLGGSLLRRDR